jgi:hypothetical protein
MKIILMKKILGFYLIFVSAVVLLIVGWDFLSGKTEEWTAYCERPAYQAMAVYPSLNECDKAMDVIVVGCGCRRTDGPYNTLNKVADVLLLDD